MFSSTEISAIREAFEDRQKLGNKDIEPILVKVLRALESGEVRVVTPPGQSPERSVAGEDLPMTGDLREWQVHSWVKEAILLCLAWRSPQTLGPKNPAEDMRPQGRIHGTDLTFFDKLDTRSDAEKAGVRVVPPGVIREGAYVARGCVVMPGFVNIGAFVGSGSMVDTWATVGSCAQIGKRVHLAGGVGIGGVLEPPAARPVLIGDDAFIGSRCIVVEGAIVSERAILGAGVCLTATTPVYDVTITERREYRGFVPPGAIVAPGTREKDFPGGRVALNCGYIIGYRNEQTDARVAINDTLREYGISL